MATTTIKSTYSLDVATVRMLEDMARRWNVSKSEALRRAIRRAAEDDDATPADALSALDELQRSLDLTEAEAARWQRRARRERRASSRRGEERSA